MTTKAPASAALLAQAVGDVAPFLGSSNRPTPSLELTEDQAMLAAPTSPSETTNAGTGDGVQLSLPSTFESWTELAVGPLGSTRRLVSFHLAALVISTFVRSASFSPKLGFGNYLLENLAPVERDGVRWAWILALRAAEIVIGARVWRRVRGAAKHDGALFGFMLALVSRVPLYTFEHSYFLLSTQTVGVLLLIDMLTFGVAFSLLPRLLPHPPAPRPTLSVFDRLAADPNQYLNILFALGLATTTTALGSFVLERFGGRKFIEHNVFEAVVPSYLLRDQLTTSEVLAHPSWTIPALRTYDAAEHLSMHAHLVHAVGSNLPLLPLALAIPSALLGPQRLALLAFALVGLPSAFILWDVLPLTTIGAFSTGIALGIRQAWSAFVIAWTLESLRRTKSVKNVKIVVYDQQVGVEGEEVADVIATTVDAKLITDASEQGMATASAVGATRTSPRRKAVLKGEVEL